MFEGTHSISDYPELTGLARLGIERVTVAESFGQRLKGLMGESEMPAGHALVFPRCSSVHMMFMRIALDLVYMDAEGRVLGVQTAKPWQIPRSPKGTKAVAECGASTITSRR